MRWKRSLISNARACNNWQDIKKNCQEFTQYCGFKHFFILGSFFNDYNSPCTQALTNYCDTAKFRFSANIHNMLAEVIDQSMVSVTPLIRGKLKNNKLHGRKSLHGTKHIRQYDEHSCINFPVHFPSGRFALLHIGTHSNQPISYDSTLSQGYQFALAICSSLFKLIENPFPETALTERERSCLILAGDGITPRMASLQLGLSIHTIQHYLKNARKKMHGKNLPQALSHALNQGIISPNAELSTNLSNTTICDL